MKKYVFMSQVLVNLFKPVYEAETSKCHQICVGLLTNYYCPFHVTLPNWVLHFILSSYLKPPFLCKFFTDWPET
jgi:hypothetical protein